MNDVEEIVEVVEKVKNTIHAQRAPFTVPKYRALPELVADGSVLQSMLFPFRLLSIPDSPKRMNAFKKEEIEGGRNRKLGQINYCNEEPRRTQMTIVCIAAEDVFPLGNRVMQTLRHFICSWKHTDTTNGWTNM